MVCAETMPTSPLMKVEQVAERLSVSARHIYRMADGGLMPRPLKLGGVNRWSEQVLAAWIADGCPKLLEPRKTQTRRRTLLSSK